MAEHLISRRSRDVKACIFGGDTSYMYERENFGIDWTICDWKALHGRIDVKRN